MQNLKVLPLIMVLSIFTPVFAEETILRIGGLDITPHNYGAIMIGPHQNPDSIRTRFANYYLELNTWVATTVDGDIRVSDGDITRQKPEPDWYPYRKVVAETLKQSNAIKYVTVYRDDRTLKDHHPLTIEITQALLYQQNRDWAIIRLNVKNLSNMNYKNLYIGLKMDADVPDKNNNPTHNDDRVGKSGRFLYIYDENQTEEKSNIIGLLPLGENLNVMFNWWDIDHDPLNDGGRHQLVEGSRENLPTRNDDYRILLSCPLPTFKAKQEIDFAYGLIESKGIKGALHAKQQTEEYYNLHVAPQLKKLPHISQRDGDKEIPGEYELFQNYPNPFNPNTSIKYALPEGCYVTISVYNLNGKLVKSLIAQYQRTGIHQVKWNGRNGRGQKVSSGLYYYRIKAGSFQMTKKMVLFQ